MCFKCEWNKLKDAVEALEKAPPSKARKQRTNSPKPRSILSLIREGFDKEMRGVISDLGKLCIGTFGTLGDGVGPDCLGTLCIRPSNDGEQKFAITQSSFKNLCLQMRCILDEHDEDPEAFREKYRVTLAGDEKARRRKRALEEGEYANGGREKILRRGAGGDGTEVIGEDGANGGEGPEVFTIDDLPNEVMTSNMDPGGEHSMEYITDYDTIEDVPEAESEGDEHYDKDAVKKSKDRESTAKRVKGDKKAKKDTRVSVEKVKKDKKVSVKKVTKDKKISVKKVTKDKKISEKIIEKLRNGKRNVTKTKGGETGTMRWEPCLRCPQCKTPDCGKCAPCTDKRQKRRCNSKNCGNMLSKAKKDKLEAWDREVAAGTTTGKTPPVNIVMTYNFTRRRCGKCPGCTMKREKRVCEDCPECDAKSRNPSVKRHRVLSCQRCSGTPA